MKAKSIKGKSTEEIQSALQQCIADRELKVETKENKGTTFIILIKQQA